MSLVYSDLKKIMTLANKLDSMGLYKEADALDKIIKESAKGRELLLGLSGAGIAAGVGTGASNYFSEEPTTPPAPTTQEVYQIPTEAKTSLGPEDFNVVDLKGRTITAIAKEAFPNLNEVTATNLILKYNPNIVPERLSGREKIKIPKIEALREIGWEREQGQGLERSVDLDPSPELIQYLKGWEKFVPTIYDTGVGQGDLTIGYGHRLTQREKEELKAKGKTIIHGVTVRLNKAISKREAEQIFNKDLDEAQSRIDRRNFNFTPQDQNKYDALVSYTFNVGNSGMNAISKSIFGDNESRVSEVMMRNISADGEKSEGLLNRRRDDLQIWTDSDYIRNN